MPLENIMFVLDVTNDEDLKEYLRVSTNGIPFSSFCKSKFG